MIKLTFNGRTVTSGAQLARELEKSLTEHVDKTIRRAAPSGVRVVKTRDGYKAEGSADDIERMVKRLGR
jgi:biotin operon repressor